MDSNNRSTSQLDGPVVIDFPTGWKSELQADARRRIIIKILDTLNRHLPFSGEEGLHELEHIAVRFEQKIYDAATSQSDYLRKISLKMLTMETKNPMPNVRQFNSASNVQNPPNPDFATELDEGEVCNPGPLTPVQYL